jgi:ribosomal protein S1
VPGVLAMVPKGEFDTQKQYSPGEEVEVTLLTINQQTRRITGSIQHVADVSPEEIEAYAPEAGFVPEVVAVAPPEVEAQAEVAAPPEVEEQPSV